MALVDVVGRGSQQGCDLRQMALAWPLAQRTTIVPIPGRTKAHRTLEILGGAALGMMPGNLCGIDAEGGKVAVQGERPPKAVLKMTGQ